jgi:EmrB/QacA subfamily drug resistance transporter
MDESRARRALLGVMLSIFLAAMEGTVVATAMPAVVERLGGLHVYSWVFSGFLLTSTVTMPLWGRLSDLWGRRPTYLAGLVIFLAGSALSGAAQSMGQLVAFRALQGIGAGSLITIGMTVVGDLYGLERRAKMQGYLSGVWGVASLAGPLIGGFLSDHVSWRWVFYINLPFGALAMLLIATALRADGPPGRRRPLDAAGLVLFSAGVSAVLLGVAEAGRTGAWDRPVVLGALGFAAACLAGFAVAERRAPEPIVPLRLFGNRMVLAAWVNGFLAGMAMFGAISFVPLYLQGVAATTATAAGFALTPFVLGWTALSVTSARLSLRLGYRPLVVAGMACLTVAFLLFTRWDGALTQGGAMRDMLVAGVGMGLTMVPMLIAVQGAVAKADLGVATSTTQFFRTVGGAIGLAVMGTVMMHRLQGGGSLEVALHGVFVVGLAVCLLAFASAFLVPTGRARELARADLRGEPTRAGG